MKRKIMAIGMSSVLALALVACEPNDDLDNDGQLDDGLTNTTMTDMTDMTDTSMASTTLAP